MGGERKRSARLEMMRKIISERRIYGQAELIAELTAMGYTVTQGTMSRDFAQMKVTKRKDSSGKRYYVLPRDNRYKRIITPEEPPVIKEEKKIAGFISLNMSGNMAVIKTLPGYAGGVAYHIDGSGMEEILGTVAGDDTIFCVVREGVSDEQLKSTFTEIGLL